MVIQGRRVSINDIQFICELIEKNPCWNRTKISKELWLGHITLPPIHLEVVSEKQYLDLFKTFLSLYHYLGYSGTVGENIKYLAFDRGGNPLACFLFGSAAWKVEPRDSFIGWDAKTRKRNLSFITNNMRFLLLP